MTAETTAPAVPNIAASWAGLRVLVVGLGRSGLAAARALAKRGARVTGTDVRPRSELAAADELASTGVALELGGHRAESFQRADRILLSPGVRSDLPPVAAARAAGIPVWGELELAYRLHPGTWVAITGTCGKTTTTLWVAEMLKASGVPHAMGGNMGTPLCDALEGVAPEARIVAEVSSFQLETIETFRPRVSAILNLSEDHLDRYPSFAAYAEAKGRLLENQTANDFCILHAEDPRLEPFRGKGKARQDLFAAARSGKVLSGWAESGALFVRLSPEIAPVHLAGVGNLRLPGTHSVENALAASLAALRAGASVDGVRAALRSFTGVPHRQELVAEFRGVKFVNDSQATKLSAVRMALLSYPRVILIAGGRDKGAPFERIADLVKTRAKRVFVIGEASSRIVAAWGEQTKVELAPSLEAAVERAAAIAEPGEAVVLAPGCASFDMFRDYMERGDCFRQAVRAWVQKQEKR